FHHAAAACGRASQRFERAGDRASVFDVAIAAPSVERLDPLAFGRRMLRRVVGDGAWRGETDLVEESVDADLHQFPALQLALTLGEQAREFATDRGDRAR